MRDWAVDRGATSFCHWFQPLGSTGVRHGNAAGVQISMLNFAADGTPSWEFDAVRARACPRAIAGASCAHVRACHVPPGGPPARCPARSLADAEARS